MSISEITNLIGSYPTNKQGQGLVGCRTMIQANCIPGYTVKISTLSVLGCNDQGLIPQDRRSRWGLSSDKTYQLFPELHRLIPRSYSYVQIINPQTQKTEYQHRMHGFYKFSSHNPLDEDDGIACQLIDPKDLARATHVLVTEKANGKTVVLTGFVFQGQKYIFGGSKNKHRLLRWDYMLEDLARVEQQEGSQNHLLMDIITEFKSQISEISEEVFKLLQQGSLCGEYNDHKHIVSNQRGKLKPIIKWFGISCNQGTLQAHEGLNGDIQTALHTLQTVGLPVIDSTLYTVPEFENLRESLKLGSDLEGWVIHWMIRESDGYRTIGVEKLKVWWYIVIRMLREILRGHKSATIPNARIKRTLLKRNQDFMKLPDGMLYIWYNLCSQFCKWFLAHNYDFNRLDFNESSVGMGNTWQDFLHDNPDLTDQFDLPELEVAHQGLQDYHFTTEEEIQNRVVVFFRGVQGLGKTYVGSQLRDYLVSLGHPTMCLEQDDFKGKTAGRQCLDKFTDYLGHDPQVLKVILLQRNNANLSQFQSYLNATKQAGWKILILNPIDLDLKSTFLVCLESILHRKHHKTFDKMDPKDRVKALVAFTNLYDHQASNSDSSYNLKWLQVNDDSSLSPYLCTQIQAIKHQPLPSIGSIMGHLGLDYKTLKYQQLRRPVSDIVEEIAGQVIPLI